MDPDDRSARYNVEVASRQEPRSQTANTSGKRVFRSEGMLHTYIHTFLSPVPYDLCVHTCLKTPMRAIIHLAVHAYYIHSLELSFASVAPGPRALGCEGEEAADYSAAIHSISLDGEVGRSQIIG